MIIYDLMRNGKQMAQVITLDNEKCVVTWPTSIIIYDSEDAARAVHIDHMGGRGELTSFEPVWVSDEDVRRGMSDCLQDDCENVPFASIGGVDARLEPNVPAYSNPILHHERYLLGYQTQARALYGPEWRTCGFGWVRALNLHLEER